jgi:D-alanyl-D-alanine-carboxypeptidase/D-alanyl-D-alanine-endopeptidase
MKKRVLWIGVSFLALVLVAIVAVVSVRKTEPDIRGVLKERLKGKEYGIVVGIVDEQGERVIARGGFGRGINRAVDADTLFELCSVTKVITSLLLADMVERGEVATDDPIDRFLPAKVASPEKNGRKITLANLATHTSGLPSTPYGSGSPSEEAVDMPGYATLTETELYGFLSTCTLTREPGSSFEYSNVGMGLLGHLLARRAGRTYEELVVERICAPLGMDSTRITLNPELEARLAPGHFRTGEPARHWMLAPPLAGAGAFRSTANDMLRFLAANIGLEPSPLSRAMQAAQQARADSEWPGVKVGLGWCVVERDGKTLRMHSGGVPGYRSFIGFSTQPKRGVVVLGNSSTDIEDIGLYLLDKELGLLESGPSISVVREPVTVAASLLDAYAGLYQVDESRKISISREEDRLLLQITRQPSYVLLPESETRFFIAQPEVLVTFVNEGGNHVSELVVRQAGREVRCPRLPPVQAAAVDTRVYDSYVGRYEVNPARAIQVTREGDRLFVQPTLEPREELYPASPGAEFLAYLSDTHVHFVTKQDGTVSGLVLRMGKNEMIAAKVEEHFKTVEVDPTMLEQLVGVYQHNPDFHLTVIKIGNRLFIKGTGQPMHELYALSETRFFAKTVPLPNEVSFARDNGRVTSLTVSAGREIETSRKIR